MKTETWSFLLGAAGIFIAIIGGGIEVKEIKISALNLWARISSFLIGCVFVGVGLYLTILETRGTSAPPTTAAPNVAPTPASTLAAPQPVPSSDFPQFGVHLITSSTIQVAQENAIKAQSVAPAGAKILLYKRMNSLWATVVIYSDNGAAGADLPKYRQDPDWKTAQVVTLESWCPKPEKLAVILPSPVGTLSTLDCHM